MNINNKNFKLALAKKCLSLKELSELSEINTVTLSRVINGIQDPHPKTLGKIAKALDVNVEYLVSNEKREEE